MTGNARILRLRIEEAATALGAANHATFGETVTATDAYGLVGSLDELVHRLPQLFGFIGRSVSQGPGWYFDDRGRDPASTRSEATGALALATAGIDVVTIQLTAAHNALGHLGLEGAEG
ncbi:hypothetical protein ACQPX6_00310 [Actinomycetospora sp. CA-101289]|uniref:hypothetical protein n=1 Tax=Actinomycetospora sp. CA-101289 TaxID=3239893 RepID=UPI003D95C79B